MAGVLEGPVIRLADFMLGYGNNIRAGRSMWMLYFLIFLLRTRTMLLLALCQTP